MIRSGHAISQAHRVEGEDAWLVMLEISHKTLAQPFRVVRDLQDIQSQGKTYTAYPFDFQLSEDDGESLPAVQITIDNVHRDLVGMFRTIEEPPAVTLRLILSSQPDVVELELDGLVLREIEYDAFTIRGTLYTDDLLSQRFPAEQITYAAGYLGLFR